MMFSFFGWKLWACLAVSLVFGLLTAALDRRNREIERLNLELDGLRLELASRVAEVERLRKAANALGLAAQGQTWALSADLARREKINDMMGAESASNANNFSAPATGLQAYEPSAAVGVIDEKTSRQALAFINADLLAPLGGGLRRAGDPARPGRPGLVPGPAGAGALAAQRH